MSSLAPTLQAFFTDRLASQRRCSQNTVAAYRDTWRLMLAFASSTTNKPPSLLDFADLDVQLVAAFLGHLETERHNSIRTRNGRLAAIRSLFRFAALRHPEHAASIQRVLAMPTKRYDRRIVTYLTEDEAKSILAACDQRSWIGRRDHALLVVAIQTGLRVSELIHLTVVDFVPGTGAHVHTMGKGRKERNTPLVPSTVAVVRAWSDERRGAHDDPLFPTSTGRRLSRDAVERRLAHYVAKARTDCPSLVSKRVTPHSLRHTAAMRLLLAGNDPTVIALWLGHEQVATTSIYLHADMAQKERAIARVAPLDAKPGRFQPADTLLAFLEAL